MSKLVSLDELAARVEDGMQIGLGGSFLHRAPCAFVRALVARGAASLELVKASPGYDLDLLCRAGVLRRARVGIAAMDCELGLLPAYRRAVERHEVELEEHSCITIVSGLRASATGVPFMPVAGLDGSEIPALNGWERIADPYGSGRSVFVVPAIRPDIAILHVNEIDEDGNARLLGSPQWDRAMSRGAARVLVTAERLVPRSRIEEQPELDGRARLHGRGGCGRPARRLARLDVPRLRDRRRCGRGLPGGRRGRARAPPRVERPRRGAGRVLADARYVVVNLARQIQPGDVVFTGVNSAVPTAACLLAKRAYPFGFTHLNVAGGVDARPPALPASSGDPALLTGTAAIFNNEDFYDLCARGGIDIAFLGAAQIDGAGRANVSAIGSWQSPQVRLPGGGGAAVMMPTARRAVVWQTSHSPRGLVERVDFATSAGASTLVTPLRGLRPARGRRLRARLLPARPDGGGHPGANRASASTPRRPSRRRRPRPTRSGSSSGSTPTGCSTGASAPAGPRYVNRQRNEEAEWRATSTTG